MAFNRPFHDARKPRLLTQENALVQNHYRYYQFAGNMLLAGAACSMGIGIAVIVKMIRFEI